jgi:hypothetical protein
MDLLEDWERDHLKDQIYIMENQHELDMYWHERNLEELNKNRKPALIKVLIQKEHEISHLSSTVRRTDKKKL